MPDTNYNQTVNVSLEFVKENTGNDPDILKEMINLFISSLPEQMEELKKAKANKDWPNVGAYAHKMKPNLDMLGVEVLYEPIRFIEKNGKAEENLEQVAEEVDKMDGKINEVVSQLEELKKEV